MQKLTLYNYTNGNSSNLTNMFMQIIAKKGSMQKKQKDKQN